MNPVNSNNQPEPNANCTPLSSNCVVWQGPDIPCLTLCSGDTITKVVYELALKVCELNDNLFDVAGIDVDCLLQVGDTAPTTQESLIQLIVDKLCEALADDPVIPGPDQLYDLPLCLQYVDGDGNTITQVTQEDYIDLIAAAVCDLYSITDDHQAQLDSLDLRVTILENQTPTTGSPLINVTTNCASGPTPGLVLPIQMAFANFEQTFCDLSAVLGTIAQINAVTDYTGCATIENADSLMTPGTIMADLPGWVANPTTLAETLTNMWITICDMRAKIIDCCQEVVVCVPVPVTTLAISNVTSNNFQISWVAPNTGVGEAPLSYQVEVYNAVSNAPSGGALFTQNYPHPPTLPITLLNGSFNENKSYAVKVTAIYNCGSAEAVVVGIVRSSIVPLCINVQEITLPGTNVDCTVGGITSSYAEVNKRLSVSLINSATGTPYSNSGATINVDIQFELTNECGIQSYYTETFSIPALQSVDTLDYVESTRLYCAGQNACNQVSRVLGCVLSISGQNIPLCPGSIIPLCAQP